MGKEILYRRSFHCDGDLKSVKNMLELEKAVESRKANADGKTLTDGGFEAPRNSLDVPLGAFPQRRHSEVRCEDIPIGYELSRSLTTRRRSEDRRNEDRLGRKSMSSADSFLSKPKFMDKGNPEGDQKLRSSSVVAKLMGLDPLPLHHQEDTQALQSSNHPSSRRLLPHDFLMPQSGSSSTDNQSGISRVPSQRATLLTTEIIPEKPRSYGDLPFRNHPQEKQLQEFKREFAVRQHKQLPASCSKVDMLGMHGKVLPNEQHGSGRETLQESQEFLDALDFLQSNKEFFVKMLKDPSILFAKNIEHPGGTVPSLHKEGLGQKGKKLTRSFSESKKESYTCLLGVHDATDSKRKHEMNRYESAHKAQNVCIPHFGQDEHMPLEPRPHAHSVLPPLKTGYDQTMPTKIVVLKPKVGKFSGSRSFSPSSPLSRLDASFTARRDGKESVKHDIKERPMVRNEQEAAKEPPKNLSKDAFKDAGDIAKQILKKVKEDMSRRLPSESFQSLESASLARSSSKGKRSAATEKLGMFVDAAGASDGEGYYSSSRRIMKGNVKPHVSLPSSPRLSRADPESDYRIVTGNVRKGVSGEKSSRESTFGNNIRDTRKDNVGARSFMDAGKKQDGIRDAKSPIKTRLGGGKDGKGASESLKVLPRSLSAPPASAATIKNRASDKDQKHKSYANRSARVKNAKTAETSLFKEKLLSLKDSFSLSKKGSSKKQATNSPSETSELSSPGQLTEEHKHRTGVDAQESGITVFPAYPWQTACLRQDDQDKAVMDGCLDYVMSVNSARESSARQQWTSTGDIFDSASDISLEKCEQPSPISILDAPFQEESPSPEQTSSECHHEASLKFSPLNADHEKCLLDLHEGLLSSLASRQSSFSSTAEEALLPGANAPLETLSVGDIACPIGSEKELVYIRDLLAFAGFSNNELISRAHSFSVEHGLDPSNFTGLESHYEKMSQRNTSSRHSAYPTPLNTLSRQMLYDVVDEILSRKLVEPTFQLGVRQAKPFAQYLYTGKQLLEQVWAHISYFRYVPCDSEEDSLDNLAAKELMKDAGWSQPPSDMQVVIRELERSICGDLIRDVVRECVRM